MRSVFARVGAWCVERPGPVIALAVLLVILGTVGALSLEPNGEADTLVDESSETFKATEELKDKFGDDPIVVLIKGDLEQFVLTEDLQRILFLESCLAGTAPEGEVAKGIETPEVCNELAESKPARVVYGPATFLNQFANQATQQFQAQQQAAQEQAQVAAKEAYKAAIENDLGEEQATLAAQAAAKQVQDQFTQQAVQIGLDYGLQGPPSIRDPTFVRAVVFDNRFTEATPKSKFSAFFPSSESVAISIRLRPDLTDEERSEAIDLIREATTEDVFQMRDASFLVSGPPVLADGLTDELSGQITILLIAALIVMALVLALVFAPPLRLLPLAVGLSASAIAFGVLAVLGGSLTMAVIAGLPILIGLAVDYAIQIQARFTEARRAGSSPARAAGEAAARGGPVVATAGLATAAGFLVLILSPIPMVQSFGLLLVGGLAIAFGLVITAGLAILSMTGSTDGKGRLAPLAGRFRTASGRSRTPEWVSRLRAGLAKLGPRSLAASIAMPGKVSLPPRSWPLAGWIAGTQDEDRLGLPRALAREPSRAQGRRRARGGDRRLWLRRRGDRRGRLYRPRGDRVDEGTTASACWTQGATTRLPRSEKPASAPRSRCPDLFGDEPPDAGADPGRPVAPPALLRAGRDRNGPRTRARPGIRRSCRSGSRSCLSTSRRSSSTRCATLVDSPGATPPPEGVEVSVEPPAGLRRPGARPRRPRR